MSVRTGIRIAGFPVETTETATSLTVTTESTRDLILNTNEGTNSGSITIHDGTAGDIELAPKGAVVVEDGDIELKPTTISTAHIKTTGSLDVRCTDNMRLGTDDADSVRIGRTNTALAKVYIRSGSDDDLVVSNSKVGIGVDDPSEALEIDGDIQLSPTASSTAHVKVPSGSLDIRCANSLKIGTDGADSVRIGRTNTTAAKVYLRSGNDDDLVVSNGKIGIGTDSPAHELDVAGDVHVSGEVKTANIGYTDGDNAITIADGGACTFAAGITSNAASNTFGTTTLGTTTAGALTADSLTVDNISINGTEIDLSSGDLTIDVAGDIKLDAGGADVEFLNAGTEFGLIGADGSNNMLIESTIQDKDILFKGDDGGSEITALTLDMSEEGAATFNSSVTANGPIAADGSLTVSGTTPRVTIGDGGEEDTNLLFDGHAADFRIGIDDGTDKLEIGAGTAHGTTAAIIVDSSGEVVKIGQDSPSNDEVLSWDGSNNKVIWSARSGGGGGAVASVSNGSNNRIATFTSSDDLNGEANLEFDGTDLSIGGAGKLEFRDTGIHISSDEDGHLQITADAHVTTSGFPSNENAIGTSATSIPSVFGADGDCTGDIIKLLNDTTTKGHIYYLSDHPSWEEAQANDTNDGGPGEMLAMAVGTNSNNDGMLVKGFMRIDSGNYNGTADIGKIGYLSDDTAGQIDFTAPAGSGEVVRVVGHCLQKDGSNHILFYFNPSNDYVEIA